MRARTPKRAAAERIYAKRRAVFLALDDGGVRCEWPLGCDQAGTEVHHRRGRVGGLLLDERHWSAVCRAHHERATLNPSEAYACGISERRIGAA